MMKTLSSAFLWAATAVLLFSACGSLFEYESSNKPPGPPFIDSMIVTTKNDTLPCVKIFIRDTNTMQVSFNMFRSGPNNADFAPFTRSQGIPKSVRVFTDTDLFSALAFRNYYDRYLYRLTAVSGLDSVSDPSLPDTLFLIESPPMIDSVYIDSVHPVVVFSVPGNQWSKNLKVEIVQSGSVLEQKEYIGELNDIIKRPYLFTAINTDSVRDTAQSVAGRTFGIRVTAWVILPQGTGWGIAVAKLVVPE